MGKVSLKGSDSNIVAESNVARLLGQKQEILHSVYNSPKEVIETFLPERSVAHTCPSGRCRGAKDMFAKTLRLRCRKRASAQRGMIF